MTTIRDIVQKSVGVSDRERFEQFAADRSPDGGVSALRCVSRIRPRKSAVAPMLRYIGLIDAPVDSLAWSSSSDDRATVPFRPSIASGSLNE